jgi:hypothetical protein
VAEAAAATAAAESRELEEARAFIERVARRRSEALRLAGRARADALEAQVAADLERPGTAAAGRAVTAATGGRPRPGTVAADRTTAAVAMDGSEQQSRHHVQVLGTVGGSSYYRRC